METQLKQEANYPQLVKEVEEFNRDHDWVKRGIADVPTMFGIAFGALFLTKLALLCIFIMMEVFCLHTEEQRWC